MHYVEEIKLNFFKLLLLAGESIITDESTD